MCKRLLPRLVILADSEIYCTGITAGLSKSIRELSGFKLGTLPVKYLAMPLIPGRLKVLVTAKALLDKILARLQHWASKRFIFCREASV